MDENDDLDPTLRDALVRDAYSAPFRMDVSLIRSRRASRRWPQFVSWLALASAAVGVGLLVAVLIPAWPPRERVATSPAPSLSLRTAAPSSAPRATAPVPPVVAHEVPQFARDPDGGGLQSAFTGRLELTPEGCLVLVRHGDIVAVAWPAPGTSWQSSPPVIVVDGLTAELGDYVRVVGGYGTMPLDDRRWVVKPSPECYEPEVWIVFRVTAVNGRS